MSSDIVLTSYENIFVKDIPSLFAAAIHAIDKENNNSELGSVEYYSSLEKFTEAIKRSIMKGELTQLCSDTLQPIPSDIAYQSTDKSIVTVKDLAEYALKIGFNIVVKPITPIQGSSYLVPKDTGRKPRWQKWRLIPVVDLWQAVALSLNIEPEKVEIDKFQLMDTDHPFDEGNDFKDRLAVLRQHASNRQYFPTSCSLSLSHWYDCKIRLDEFSTWCIQVGYEIPTELEQLKLSAQGNVSVKNLPTSQGNSVNLIADSNVSDPIDWRVKARIIADEIFDRDTKLGTRDCLIKKRPGKSEIVGGYAMRVMEEMQKREIHAPRGNICNPATIAREALQGDQWWSKKSK